MTKKSKWNECANYDHDDYEYDMKSRTELEEAESITDYIKKIMEPEEDYYFEDETENADVDSRYYLTSRSGEAIALDTGDEKEKDSFSFRGAKRYMIMAKRCCEIYECEIDAKGIIFLSEKDYVYERPDTKRREQLILQTLSDAERDTLPPEKGVKNIIAKMEHLLLNKTGRDVSEVLKFNIQEVCINFQNGVLELPPRNEPILYKPSLELTRKNRFSYRLNAKYISKKKRVSTPHFDKYVRTTFGEEAEIAREALLQRIGYILGNSMRGKCIIIFLGQSNSGKTVIMQFLEEVIPVKNRSNIPFQDLGNPVKVAELDGKLVNMHSELSSEKLSCIDALKALSSGDRVLGEKKFCDPVAFTNTAKLVCFTNTFPKPKNLDPTDGFFSRLRVLYFPRSIPPEERDPELLEKLLREKDEIVSEAIDYYGELLDNNFSFTDTPSSKRYLEMYKNSMNSFQLFLETEMIIHPKAKVHSCILSGRYERFCRDNGLEIMKARKINEILSLKPNVEHKKFSWNDEYRYGYKGLGCRDQWPDLVDQEK